AGFAGVVQCEVLEAEPEKLLKLSWTDGRVDWTVSWRLVPEGRGTRLFLDHEGIDPDDPRQQMSRRILGRGWRPAPRKIAEPAAPASGGRPRSDRRPISRTRRKTGL